MSFSAFLLLAQSSPACLGLSLLGATAACTATLLDESHLILCFLCANSRLSVVDSLIGGWVCYGAAVGCQSFSVHVFFHVDLER